MFTLWFKLLVCVCVCVCVAKVLKTAVFNVFSSKCVPVCLFSVCISQWVHVPSSGKRKKRCVYPKSIPSVVGFHSLN